MMSKGFPEFEYRPAPIPTGAVQLSEDLLSLVEDLSRNAHDVWAFRRTTEGWRWGPKRDDDRKEHPCLIPYSELTESEKDMDRAAVLETIKMMVALGYVITR